MKKLLNSVFVALFLLLPVAWSGCAGTPTRETTGEYVDDSVVTTKVKSELGADKMLSLYQISVETYRGVVQLSGFVNSHEVANRAVEVTRQVKGVREVKNSLVVKPQ